MVKIAIAGPGQLAREVIDGLVATGKHEIVVLSRRDATPEQLIDGTTWVKVDYHDKIALVQAFQGVHTVLSFVVAHLDVDNVAQKTLIDAAIEAGVKRIAPSEWAVADITHLDFYANKLVIRAYLEEKNRDKKVIEYTLFQPSWYLNYLAGLRKTTKHIEGVAPVFDYENYRVLAAGDLDRPIPFTAIPDIVNIVVKAIEYDGEWPTVGGITGTTLSTAQIVALGEKIRGKQLDVETLDLEDLKAGVVKSSWVPVIDIPGLDEATKVEFSKGVARGLLLTFATTTFPESPAWNRIFPDYKFIQPEEFLTEVWGEKA